MRIAPDRFQPRWLRWCFVVLTAFLSLPVPSGGATVLPPGFTETDLGAFWVDTVGLTLDHRGRMYVWDLSGHVWLVENGVKPAQPLIDIVEEVARWRDFGLLGFALHPNFATNGQVFLLYTVDHHHLTKFGTPQYGTYSNENFQATIGRITRYTLNAANDFRTCDYASRRVLVGDSISNGIPSLHQSHNTGQLVFGTDGTLLASVGDGASYGDTDVGSYADTWYQQALNEKIIRAPENVGAFRAQMVDSLAGKILRLDPDTGNGVPGNPFYDAAHPQSARSRVWALGLRNPYRMTLRPNTGSTNRAAAKPGTLYIGDVGWNAWEELNVCDGPGLNFGWPAFEGLEPNPTYRASTVENREATNSLYNGTTCTRRHFMFNELLVQETRGTPSWTNPCNKAVQIPASIPKFMHRRPVLDWLHSSAIARTGVFSGTNAAVSVIGSPGSPVSGQPFPGNASTAGAWCRSNSFPAQYHHTYFHADWGAHWIKNFVFDTNNRPVAVRDFAAHAGGVACMTVDERTGDLYYVSLATAIRKISYVGTNGPPVAVASADVTYGKSPLNVQFSSAGSADPGGGPLTYAWEFGDGTTTNGVADPVHTYEPLTPTRYEAKLIVRNVYHVATTNRVTIFANDLPPVPTILRPTNNTPYPLTGPTVVTLAAIAADPEELFNELRYSWKTILHHNTHSHEEPPDTNRVTTTRIDPLGCGDETYFYEVELSVTDSLGLSATQSVFLLPNCAQRPPPVPTLTSPSADQVFPWAAGASLAANVASNGWHIEGVQFYVDGAKVGESLIPPYSFLWTGDAFGHHDAEARALYMDGAVGSPVVPFFIEPTEGAPLPQITLSQPSDGAVFISGQNVSVNALVVSNGWRIDQMVFRSDGQIVGEKTNAPYSFNWVAPAAGCHQVTARAYYGPSQFVEAGVRIAIISGSPALKITLIQPAGDGFQLETQVAAGCRFVVEGSVNFSQWDEVSGVIEAGNPVLVPGRSGYRFFRLRLVP